MINTIISTEVSFNLDEMSKKFSREDEIIIHKAADSLICFQTYATEYIKSKERNKHT